jgi:hypothetical protein
MSSRKLYIYVCEDCEGQFVGPRDMLDCTYCRSSKIRKAGF